MTKDKLTLIGIIGKRVIWVIFLFIIGLAGYYGVYGKYQVIYDENLTVNKELIYIEHLPQWFIQMEKDDLEFVYGFKREFRSNGMLNEHSQEESEMQSMNAPVTEEVVVTNGEVPKIQKTMVSSGEKLEVVDSGYENSYENLQDRFIQKVKSMSIYDFFQSVKRVVDDCVKYIIIHPLEVLYNLIIFFFGFYILYMWPELKFEKESKEKAQSVIDYELLHNRILQEIEAYLHTAAAEGLTKLHGILIGLAQEVANTIIDEVKRSDEGGSETKNPAD